MSVRHVLVAIGLGGLLLLSLGAADPVGSAEKSLLERAYDLDEGIAGPRDAAAAAALYRQAAEAGDAFAHLRLGYLAETGDGVPQDYAAARAHYQAAVDAGLAEARVRLAICHLEGWGGPADRSAFAREIRLAAEAGEVTAQRILATLSFLGFGVPENRTEALQWLEKAARQDDAAAQFRLGTQVEKARRGSLRSDVSLARTWYELSAEQEYRASMRAMARTFLQAPRGEQNWEMGFRWLKLAADAGDAEAGFVLAMHELLHRDSPTRDVDQARAWLQMASSRGNVRAREVLELEISGRSLADSIRYVLSEPFEERYIRWVNSRIPDPNAPTRRPEIYRVVKPIYPQALRFTETNGKVLLEFVIDQTGRVTDAKAVESPHPLFTERALEAVVQWRFHPARVDGRPVSTKARQLMEFSMDNPEFTGLDDLLAGARGMAEKLGTVPAADYSELRLAKPRSSLPPLPRLPDGQVPPPESRVLLLLSLDAGGKPLRGYVLDAKPEAIGEAYLAWALGQVYEPRLINGEAVPSNVILPRVMKPSAAAVKAGL